MADTITERQQGILERLEAGRTCSYAELAGAWQVSEMTIRRDVDRLAGTGALVKILGGVYRPREAEHLYETALESRLSECVAEKRAIAALAVTLAATCETIYLDGGTTCIHLARRIARDEVAISVVTHSPMVCLELARSERVKVIGLGGELDANSLCFFGTSCEAAAHECYVDHAFLTTKGFLPAEGTYESFAGTARIKQIMVGQSATVTLLIDHSKFGRRALRKVVNASQINTVVTDDSVDGQLLASAREHGCNVLVAPVDSRQQQKE